MSCSVLEHLHPVQQLATNTSKHAVAVVKSAADESMNNVLVASSDRDCLYYTLLQQNSTNSQLFYDTRSYLPLVFTGDIYFLTVFTYADGIVA